jgi:hypothetical protein
LNKRRNSPKILNAQNLVAVAILLPELVLVLVVQILSPLK